MNFKKNERFFLDLGQDNRMESQSRYYGGYTIPPHIGGDIAIDLGSNIGLFSIENHKKFKDIFAIEANYWNFLTTIHNLSQAKIANVKCFNMAAAKETGKVVKMYQNGYDSVSSTTSAEMIGALGKEEADEYYHNVFSISLEGMFDYFALNYVNFMKIDIEGAEYDFLLDKDLSMIHSLAIEIHGTFGQEKKNQLMNHIDKYFNIYDIQYNDPAPDHSVITYINKDI